MNKPIWIEFWILVFDFIPRTVILVYFYSRLAKNTTKYFFNETSAGGSTKEK